MKKLCVFILIWMMAGEVSWASNKENTVEGWAGEYDRVYLLVFGSPQDAEKVRLYKTAAGTVMKKYGAKFPVKQFKVDDVIKGGSNPSFLNSVEFPNKESIYSALSDPEYLNVINDRNTGFNDLTIVIVTH